MIVDAEGEATVTDFGIARSGASDMTQTGSIMGTAQYLSPEQAQGHAVGAESDLYSVGIILYEMLTGRVPFDGDSAVAIALKQVSEAPLAAERDQPGGHAGARERGAAGARARSRPARYADAGEFIAALEAARARADARRRAADGATMVGVPPVAADRARAAALRARRRRPRTTARSRTGGCSRSPRCSSSAILIAALLLLRKDQVTVPRGRRQRRRGRARRARAATASRSTPSTAPSDAAVAARDRSEPGGRARRPTRARPSS